MRGVPENMENLEIVFSTSVGFSLYLRCGNEDWGLNSASFGYTGAGVVYGCGRQGQSWGCDAPRTFHDKAKPDWAWLSSLVLGFLFSQFGRQHTHLRKDYVQQEQ